MSWLWILLFVVLGLLVAFILFVSLVGGWKSTVKTVLPRFLLAKYSHPNQDFMFWYFLTIEDRYPLVVSGFRRELYDRKEVLLSYSQQIMYVSEQTELYKMLNKHTLPSLIIFCMVVDNSSLFHNAPVLRQLYCKIEAYVTALGYGEYC